LNDGTDYSMDYNSMSGFLRRENSAVTGETKLHIQPHDKALHTVQEFMNKGKAKAQERIEKKHQLNLIEENKEDGENSRSRHNSDVHSEK
jgi:hypothetical protein